MSGHSKWTQIKHKKAATDAKRSKLFSKLAAFITIAAREKGGDPSMNPKLRMSIEKAKSMNMPMDNIERAVKKGAGGNDGQNFEDLLLEAYGPNGKALLITAITDNKNRTNAEIKHILNEFGGKMANSGSVRWLFEEKGQIVLENEKLSDELELKIIEAGAEDVEAEDNQIIILTKTENLESVKKALIENNLKISESTIGFFPKNLETVTDSEKATYEKLYEALDDYQDVDEVYFNFNF
jgi:YebC/PmpR family DNA-binding regulatory protein